MPRWFRKSATVGREGSCCLPFRRGRGNREGEYRPTPTPSPAEEKSRTSKKSKRRFGFGSNLGKSESRSNDMSIATGEPSELGQEKTDIMVINHEDCDSPVGFIKDLERPRAPLDLKRLQADRDMQQAGDIHIDWGWHHLPNYIPDAHSNVLKVNPPDKFARRPSAPIDLDRYPVSPDEPPNLYTISESEEYGIVNYLRVASSEGTYVPSSPGSSMSIVLDTPTSKSSVPPDVPTSKSSVPPDVPTSKSSVPPDTPATPCPTRRRSLGQRIVRFFSRFQRNRVISL